MLPKQQDIPPDAAVIQSSAVAFFRGTPRWPGGQSNFSVDFEYFTPVALTALLPLFASFVLLAILLCLLVFRYTRLETKIDERIIGFEKSRKSILRHLLISSLLMFGITFFIGMSMASLAYLNFSFHTALDVINGVADDIFLLSSSLIDVAEDIRGRLETFTPSMITNTSDIIPPIGDMLTPAFQTLQSYALEKYPNISALDKVLTTRFDQIKNVLSITRRVITSTTAGLLTIILLLLSTPLIHLLIDSIPLSRRFRFARLVLHSLIVILPTLLAWSFFGVSSATGAVIADVCSGLGEYRSVLLGIIDETQAQGNALVEGGVTCPDLDSKSVMERFQGTVNATLQNEFVQSTVEMILRLEAKQIADTARWSGERVGRYADCEILKEFSGKLESIGCGKQGVSSIQAVNWLWWGLLGLAITLTVTAGTGLMGIRVGGVLGEGWKVERKNDERDEEDVESEMGDAQVKRVGNYN